MLRPMALRLCALTLKSLPVHNGIHVGTNNASLLGCNRGIQCSEPHRFPIRSVLNQTHRDYEVIVIGDGCTVGHPKAKIGEERRSRLTLASRPNLGCQVHGDRGRGSVGSR